MFGPNTPATLIVLAASMLLLLVSISTPILRPFYFLSVDISPSDSFSTSAAGNRTSAVISDLKGTVKLGLFGYCVQVGSQVACSSPRFGYTFEPSSMVSLPSNINLDFSNWLVKVLTYPLILHPIASGLGFVSAITGLISHFREFSRSCATSWLSSLAAAVALSAFVFDILAFSLARSRINGSTTNSNFTLNARLGNAIWITLAGWISLTVSGCFFCAGRRIHARRQRDQSQSHLIRPELDKDYSSKMREQAEKAEQDREKGAAVKPSHSNLPSFAEYADQDAGNQEHIPLNSFQPDEEMYLHLAGHREPHEGEALEGVGAGYGRRQWQGGLSHQPSVMSQATVYTHPSRSQPPLMPPMPQPAQPYHSQYSSPSNHAPAPLPLPSSRNQPVSDLYSNLPPHVTPATNYMNQPAHTNSLNQRPHTNSTSRRLPQSLIPAGMPTTGGAMAYETHRAGLPRAHHASTPPSQQSPMSSAQAYGLPQPVNHSSLPSSQSTVSGFPQPDVSGEPYRKPMSPQQRYTLDDSTPIKSSGSLPPIYQTHYNQADPNQKYVPQTNHNQMESNHVLHSTGSSESRKDDNVHNYSPPPRATPLPNRHDDPFTQTYDFGPYTRNPHVTEEAAAGLADDRINDSSHLLSPLDEYDPQSGGDTDYTVASSAEQPPLENRTSRRELPQLPVLPPLSFISPAASPLPPRNNFDFSGITTAASHVQVTDNSHTSPPVYK